MTVDLAGEITDPSARGIALAIGRLVTAGALAPGERLPTVRELAADLGISPTTVSEAWKRLAEVGAIEARGRLGTFVRPPAEPGSRHRYRQVTEGPGHFELDLSTGTPDVALLPDLRPVMARVSRQHLTSTYVDPPVLPELGERLRASWPFPPEALTVVDGAMDAIDRVAQQVVRLGDRVVVEHPTFPPVLDLFDQLGAEVIGVDVDDEGISRRGLAEALALDPSLVFLQPRAQNPTGATMTAARARAVARLLAPGRAVILEDDHGGEIASGELVSVGRWLPERTVHVRSFSKSHGPDLRLAGVGGSAAVVDAVAERRLLGPGWSSRILQSVLVSMLDDPDTRDQIDHARRAYAHRRRRFADALRAHGVASGGADGINQWVPVADERAALVTLAAQGVGVAPGEPFQVRPDADHLRITIGLVADDGAIDRLAEQVADAASAGATRTRA